MQIDNLALGSMGGRLKAGWDILVPVFYEEERLISAISRYKNPEITSRESWVHTDTWDAGLGHRAKGKQTCQQNDDERSISTMKQVVSEDVSYL